MDVKDWPWWCLLGNLAILKPDGTITTNYDPETRKIQTGFPVGVALGQGGVDERP